MVSALRVMPNLSATIGKAIAKPRSMRISLMPKKTATAFSLRKPALSSLSRTLPSSCSSEGRSDCPSLLAALVTCAWNFSCRPATCSSASLRPSVGFMIRRSRSSAPLLRSASAERMAQTASVIDRKTRKGSKASRVTGTVIHTLIATILLIIQAPSSCRTPVTTSILVPTEVVNRGLI